MFAENYRLLALALVACAIGQGTAHAENGASDEYANIHTIAVVSTLGSDITMQTYGATVFGNAVYTLRANWSPDAVVVQQIKAALGGRFAISSAVDPQAFSNLTSSPLDDVESALRQRVLAQPKTNGVDAYIVVVPDVLGAMGLSLRGLQVTRYLAILSDGNTGISASYKVEVIDAATGNRIDYGTARYPASGYLTGYSSPLEFCDNAMWAASAAQLTDAQQAMIQQEMAYLTGKGTPYALVGANLISDTDATALAQKAAPMPNTTCHIP